MEAESYIENFKVHGLLGDGGQANVYLASKNQDLFAIKVYFPGSSKEEAFKKEVQFLSKLNFKYLINIVDSKIDTKVKIDGAPEVARPAIILEFAEGGELFEYIAKQGKVKPDVCRTIIKMLLESIQYLDSVGVAHRDLKPENVLFDRNFNLKVSDFGLSTISEGHDGDGILYTRLGTQGYKPPEMEQGKYTGLQADLFAAGVILFVLYTGTPPFLSTKNTDKIYKLIRDGNFTKFWTLHEKKKPAGFYPDSFKRLLNSFFTANVQQRPTFQALKQDEWLCEDQAMQNQVCEIFKAKYARMVQTDANKKKIEQAKISILEQHIMEEENQCCSEDRLTYEGFLKVYKDNSSIVIEDLPVSGKEKVVAIKANPAFALAWLTEYLNKAQKQQNIFIEQGCQQIAAVEYSLDCDESCKKVEVRMKFSVDQDFQELNIVGKLVQMKDNKFGVEWQGEKGNAFWLESIISNLNCELMALTD